MSPTCLTGRAFDSVDHWKWHKPMCGTQRHLATQHVRGTPRSEHDVHRGQRPCRVPCILLESVIKMSCVPVCHFVPPRIQQRLWIVEAAIPLSRNRCRSSPTFPSGPAGLRRYLQVRTWGFGAVLDPNNYATRGGSAGLSTARLSSFSASFWGRRQNL